MARYEGPGPIRGKIGNWVFYVRNGKFYVRKLGKISEERLKNDRKLEGLRKHWVEFGAQSTASKSLRLAFTKVDDFIHGLHNRLMPICATITRVAPGKRGQRPLHFSKARLKFKGLEFNGKCTLFSVMKSPIKSTPAESRTSSVVEIGIDISRHVVPEVRATHFRIAHALGVLSDVEYEPALEGFVPVAHAVHGIGEVTYSDYISLEEKNASVRLETTLPLDEIPANAVVIEAVGIRFCQDLGDYYDLKMSGAMRVVNVF